MQPLVAWAAGRWRPHRSRRATACRPRLARASVPNLQGADRRALFDAQRRPAPRVHTARLRPARGELVWRPAVWEELERRGATVVVVSFWGRAGRGGQTERIDLLRVESERLVEVERWTSRDELCYALEAPVWERFGTFAGLPLTQGEVVWTAADRSVLIRGRRGGRMFEEFVR
jgi:hypothetical protein